MRVLAVIPAHNEAQNIVNVVEEIKEYYHVCDYIVVNDGSTDNTAEICRSHSYNILDLPINLGLTGAFQAGVRYAYEHGYHYVIQIDGDGQHMPQYIESMLKASDKLHADIVIGSRFVTMSKPRTLRMIGNSLISWAIRLTTGKRINDPTSGMRLYSLSVMKYMAYGINEGPEPDTLAYLIRNGAFVTEVQVSMRERIAGESYLNIGRSIKYMAQMCIDILILQWVRSDCKCLGE